MAESRLPASKTFPAFRFRDAIRGVWEMGMTPDEQPVTFCWNPVTTYPGSKDSTGVAFDPSARPTVTQRAKVVVPCGVEYGGASDNDTNFGDVVSSRIKITMFDEDYDTIKDSDYVELEDEKYVYHHDEPPFGLFGVGLHVLVYAAVNDQ
jgi:formate-dependent nitrite reductase cytochrome c552 subunit